MVCRRHFGQGLLLALIACTITGCTGMRHYWFPADGYVADGTPSQPLEVARSICLEQSEFTSGLSWYRGNDWDEFRDCMDAHGWVQR